MRNVKLKGCEANKAEAKHGRLVKVSSRYHGGRPRLLRIKALEIECPTALLPPFGGVTSDTPGGERQSLAERQRPYTLLSTRNGAKWAEWRFTAPGALLHSTGPQGTTQRGPR